MQLVFLVHGTWGRGESAWYQSTSSPNSFAAKIKKEMGDRGVDLDAIIFVPFEWKGGNTHADRLEGAKSLASRMFELRRQYVNATFHFVAHSHGGNVVLKGLEIYVNDLASAEVPKLIDSRDVVEISQRVLHDCSDGRYRFCSPTNEVDKLLRELTDTLERIAQRDRTRLIVKMTEGSIYDVERGSLRRLLAKIFRHIYTLPEQHRIGNLITLGTPFYEKRWRLTRATKMVNWLLYAVSFLPAISTAAYVYIVLGAAVASATPWISWIGFNPLEWPWQLLSFVGVFSLISACYLAVQDKPELPLDTNVYFDEANIPYFVRILETTKLCRVLNIHASYLDEAYCLLSAYPLMSGHLAKHLALAASPKFWEFKRTSEDVGFWRRSSPAILRRKFKQISQLTIALAKALAFPFRLCVHKIITLYVARLIEMDLRVLGYGLPSDEFHRGSAISVEKALHKPYFETHTFDVSRALAVLRVKGVNGTDRFEFLWNEDNLAKRVEDSVLVKTIGETFGPDHYRKLVALEERAMEFFGVAGLRHSMYYDNDVVISGIADFLAHRDLHR